MTSSASRRRCTVIFNLSVTGFIRAAALPARLPSLRSLLEHDGQGRAYDLEFLPPPGSPSTSTAGSAYRTLSRIRDVREPRLYGRAHGPAEQPSISTGTGSDAGTTRRVRPAPATSSSSARLHAAEAGPLGGRYRFGDGRSDDAGRRLVLRRRLERPRRENGAPSAPRIACRASVSSTIRLEHVWTFDAWSLGAHLLDVQNIDASRQNPEEPHLRPIEIYRQSAPIRGADPCRSSASEGRFLKGSTEAQTIGLRAHCALRPRRRIGVHDLP